MKPEHLATGNPRQGQMGGAAWPACVPRGVEGIPSPTRLPARGRACVLPAALGTHRRCSQKATEHPPPQEASGCGKTSLPEPQPSLQLLAPGPIVQMRRLRQRWKFLKATLLYLLESSGGPWTVFPSSPHLSYCDFDMGSSFLLENFSHLAPLQVKVSRLPWPAAGQYTF